MDTLLRIIKLVVIHNCILRFQACVRAPLGILSGVCCVVFTTRPFRCCRLQVLRAAGVSVFRVSLSRGFNMTDRRLALLSTELSSWLSSLGAAVPAGQEKRMHLRGRLSTRPDQIHATSAWAERRRLEAGPSMEACASQWGRRPQAAASSTYAPAQGAGFPASVFSRVDWTCRARRRRATSRQGG